MSGMGGKRTLGLPDNLLASADVLGEEIERNANARPVTTSR